MQRRREDRSRFPSTWQSPHPCSSTPVFGAYGTAAFNAPIAYFPEILAVALLRAVGAPIPLIFFAGRLATLLAFVGIFYLAIRLIPMGKQVLFVLGLFPTTLLLASTYSADPMPIALAVLAISLTLRCRRAEVPDKHAFLYLFLVLAALTLTKPTMFIFAPLLFMVPSPGIGPKRLHPRILQASRSGRRRGTRGRVEFHHTSYTDRSRLRFESAQTGRIHPPRPFRLCVGAGAHILRKHGRGTLAARIRLLDWLSPLLSSGQHLCAGWIGDRRCVDVVVRLSAPVWREASS